MYGYNIMADSHEIAPVSYPFEETAEDYGFAPPFGSTGTGQTGDAEWEKPTRVGSSTFTEDAGTKGILGGIDKKALLVGGVILAYMFMRKR